MNVAFKTFVYSNFFMLYYLIDTLFLLGMDIILFLKLCDLFQHSLHEKLTAVNESTFRWHTLDV